MIIVVIMDVFYNSLNIGLDIWLDIRLNNWINMVIIMVMMALSVNACINDPLVSESTGDSSRVSVACGSDLLASVVIDGNIDDGVIRVVSALKINCNCYVSNGCSERNNFVHFYNLL